MLLFQSYLQGTPLMPGAMVPVFIIRMAVLVPILMAVVAVMVGGAEGVMVEVVVVMVMSTMLGLMGNGVVAAVEMDMGQGTNIVFTSHRTLGLLLPWLF